MSPDPKSVALVDTLGIPIGLLLPGQTTTAREEHH